MISELQDCKALRRKSQLPNFEKSTNQFWSQNEVAQTENIDDCLKDFLSVHFPSQFVGHWNDSVSKLQKELNARSICGISKAVGVGLDGGKVIFKVLTCHEGEVKRKKRKTAIAPLRLLSLFSSPTKKKIFSSSSPIVIDTSGRSWLDCAVFILII